MFSAATIDFMNHYKLVDSGRVDMYARAFVVNDEDLDFNVNARVSIVNYTGHTRLIRSYPSARFCIELS